MAKRPRSDSEQLAPPSSLVPPGVETDAAVSLSSAPLQTTSYSNKYRHVSVRKEEEQVVIRCALAPHKLLNFSSFADYNAHYQQKHVHRCLECGKNFPSNRFLELHIAENHDPFTEAKKERGDKTYACLVQNCEKKFHTPSSRSRHAVTVHNFHKKYDFLIINNGIDHRWSMLRPRKDRTKKVKTNKVAVPAENADEDTDAGSEDVGVEISPAGTADGEDVGMADEAEDPDCEMNQASQAPDGAAISMGKKGRAETSNADEGRVKTEKGDTPMEEITRSLSALRFVPRSVKFGHGKGKGGFARR